MLQYSNASQTQSFEDILLKIGMQHPDIILDQIQPRPGLRHDAKYLVDALELDEQSAQWAFL